ncbi:MAG: HEAT repeat domain-containing protein [Planctomycetota bacterium]
MFVDAAGNDTYTTGRVDGDTWVWADIGVGCDLGSGAKQRAALQAVPGDKGEKPLPPNTLPQKPAGAQLSEPQFRALWARASAWNIGDVRKDVRAARDELVAWGPRCLHFIEREMGAGGSWIGPVLWAIDDVLREMAKQHPEAVRMLLRNVTARKNSQERTIGMMIGASLGEDVVAQAILEDIAVPQVARFAVTAAGHLKLQEALPPGIRKLAASSDETEVATAVRALGRFPRGVGQGLITQALKHRSFLVRDTAQRVLGGMKPRGGQSLFSGLVKYPDYFGGG